MKRAQAAASAAALVVAGHGRHYLLEDEGGRRFIGHPRGKKSDCVVGDRVAWQSVGEASTDHEAQGVITAVLPRRNLLYRQDDWKTKAFAANLDRVLVMVAAEPVFSESQLARALIACEDAGIAASILLNKADLPAVELARERLEPYRRMGVPLIELAIKADPAAAVLTLEPLLAGRTTLVLGPSGVGKSTLVNLLVPDAQAQVGDISQALNSGRHTTTHTRWYWRGPAGSPARAGLIDSPGFQEFGLRQVDPEGLVARMPDLAQHAGHCRFYNCTHLHEPGCGIRDAAARGDIAPNRMRIYEALRAELARPVGR